MNDLLLALIRQVVLACEERHGYMPNTEEEARQFQPHQWVRDVADQWATQAYAEGRKDEADENGAASRMIDAWAAAHLKPVPWAKAVEIVAIINKLPEAERTRLLALAEAA
jgi:hypothetical protein